ncbi:MAG: zinc ribbon domain-containing protein, partial [Candidatus Lokiarchaeota archaeon]|nr:zinc ribbon domain-containing protein [Candidatus Lokiarchaeota archaeon]
IDFFIADGNNLNEWNSYESYSFELEIYSTMTDSGSLLITEFMGAKDYYLVWYNEEITDVNVEFIVNYTATEVIDLTEAEYYVEAVDLISESSITVPNDGNWYFFVYFDPMNSPEESTSVTFDVSYDTGVNSIDRWIDFKPILLIIGVIVFIIIIAAVLARRSQKKLKAKAPSKPSAKSPYVKAKPTASVTCVRCGSELQPNDQFCRNCGGKREGRAVGGSSITTPAKSKICAYCGSKIPAKAKFCGVCGTKIGE